MLAAGLHVAIANVRDAVDALVVPSDIGDLQRDVAVLVRWMDRLNNVLIHHK